jgi:DNA topoisomerase-1
MGEAGGDGEKPKTSSLFKGMSLNDITLEDALRLLTIPRTLGVDPENKEPVTAHNGKFGPYIKRGTQTANMGVENEPKLLTMTLEEALELLKQPRVFRGRGSPKPPLKECGTDPVSGKPIVAKEGRFGIYVTDGETNASIRRGDRVEDLTPERAAELLAERREKQGEGGAKPKRGARRGAGGPKKAAPAAAKVAKEPKEPKAATKKVAAKKKKVAKAPAEAAAPVKTAKRKAKG